MKTLLKWMIWGYPYFRKPPCICFFTLVLQASRGAVCWIQNRHLEDFQKTSAFNEALFDSARRRHWIPASIASKCTDRKIDPPRGVTCFNHSIKHMQTWWVKWTTIVGVNFGKAGHANTFCIPKLGRRWKHSPVWCVWKAIGLLSVAGTLSQIFEN